MGGVVDTLKDATLNVVTGGLYGQAQSARAARRAARETEAATQSAIAAANPQMERTPLAMIRRRRAGGGSPGFSTMNSLIGQMGQRPPGVGGGTLLGQ